MNKQEFVEVLEQHLIQLPQMEKEHVLNFYNETIEDRKEDGMSEEEAIASLGSIEDIVGQIALEKVEQEVTLPNRKKNRRVIKLSLLIILSPIWFSLLIAAIMIYLTFWMLILSMFLLILAFILFFFVGIWNVVPILQVNTAPGIVLIGFLFVSVGVIPFLCRGIKISFRWLIKQTKAWWIMLKNGCRRVVR